MIQCVDQFYTNKPNGNNHILLDHDEHLNGKHNQGGMQELYCPIDMEISQRDRLMHTFLWRGLCHQDKNQEHKIHNFLQSYEFARRDREDSNCHWCGEFAQQGKFVVFEEGAVLLVLALVLRGLERPGRHSFRWSLFLAPGDSNPLSLSQGLRPVLFRKGIVFGWEHQCNFHFQTDFEQRRLLLRHSFCICRIEQGLQHLGRLKSRPRLRVQSGYNLL